MWAGNSLKISNLRHGYRDWIIILKTISGSAFGVYDAVWSVRNLWTLRRKFCLRIQGSYLHNKLISRPPQNHFEHEALVSVLLYVRSIFNRVRLLFHQNHARLRFFCLCVTLCKYRPWSPSECLRLLSHWPCCCIMNSFYYVVPWRSKIDYIYNIHGFRI